MSYVVLIVLPAPTPWQATSEAIYGPFVTREDAEGVIARAVNEGALRIAVFPLNSSHTAAMEIR